MEGFSSWIDGDKDITSLPDSNVHRRFSSSNPLISYLGLSWNIFPVWNIVALLAIPTSVVNYFKTPLHPQRQNPPLYHQIPTRAGASGRNLSSSFSVRDLFHRPYRRLRQRYFPSFTSLGSHSIPCNSSFAIEVRRSSPSLSLSLSLDEADTYGTMVAECYIVALNKYQV